MLHWVSLEDSIFFCCFWRGASTKQTREADERLKTRPKTSSSGFHHAIPTVPTRRPFICAIFLEFQFGCLPTATMLLAVVYGMMKENNFQHKKHKPENSKQQFQSLLKYSWLEFIISGKYLHCLAHKWWCWSRYTSSAEEMIFVITLRALMMSARKITGIAHQRT